MLCYVRTRSFSFPTLLFLTFMLSGSPESNCRSTQTSWHTRNYNLWCPSPGYNWRPRPQQLPALVMCSD